MIENIAVNRRERLVARAFRLKLPKATQLGQIEEYRSITAYGEERDRL